ncbi:hypothetical protein ACVWXM_009547 [Bradyrhizobium sp. GM7.3]
MRNLALNNSRQAGETTHTRWAPLLGFFDCAEHGPGSIGGDAAAESWLHPMSSRACRGAVRAREPVVSHPIRLFGENLI